MPGFDDVFFYQIVINKITIGLYRQERVLCILVDRKRWEVQGVWDERMVAKGYSVAGAPKIIQVIRLCLPFIINIKRNKAFVSQKKCHIFIRPIIIDTELRLLKIKKVFFLRNKFLYDVEI